MKNINEKSFFCSWSGGKDSCLALYHAIKNGGVPKALLTMTVEDGIHSRSHGLPLSIFEQQASALNIPLVTRSTSWDSYEEVFLTTIREFKTQGIEYGVFGDIDLEGHLEWVDRVCSSASIQFYEPLWKRKRIDLLNEFLDLGFEATIISIKEEKLDKSYLGKSLNRQLISEMEKTGIDISGEEGEYHTVVSGGPIFSHSIPFNSGEITSIEGYSFLEVL